MGVKSQSTSGFKETWRAFYFMVNTSQLTSTFLRLFWDDAGMFLIQCNQGISLISSLHPILDLTGAAKKQSRTRGWIIKQGRWPSAVVQDRCFTFTIWPVLLTTTTQHMHFYSFCSVHICHIFLILYWLRQGLQRLYAADPPTISRKSQRDLCPRLC